MAIAFDATASGSASPGTSITFSHTCGGSDRILLVGIGGAGSTGDCITGVTYNGVAMTRVPTNGYKAVASVTSWMYFLINPASGANNVVVSSSGSVYIRAVSASYTGVSQSTQLDGSGNASANPGTSIATSVTTSRDNCWNISLVTNSNALAMTNSTGVTNVRGNKDNVTYIGDSNSAKTPAGAYSMTWTCSSQELVSIQVSIAPKVSGIDFDSANSSYTASNTSLTYSHTCAGSNLYLLVGAWIGSTSDLVTGITYNGVSMTRIDKKLTASETLYLYGLANPSTGANNIVISASSSTAIFSASESLTGAKQTGQPDSYGDATASGNVTASTTVVADNCWIVSVAGSDSSTLSVGTGVTSRSIVVNTVGIGDSNGVVTTGSNSQTWNQSGSRGVMIIASISPAPASSGSAFFQFFL